MADMKTRLVAAFAAIAIILTMSACGDDPKAPDITAPSGFTTVRDAKTGFAIAVPSDWTQIPLNEDLDVFNTDSNRLRISNPKLASAIVAARELQQNGSGRLVAVRSDGLAKINVTFDKAKEKTIDEISKVSIKGLLAVGATDMNATRLTISDRRAVRLSFHLAVKMDDGTVTQEENLYIVQRNRDAFFVTIIGVDAALADTVATSMKIR